MGVANVQTEHLTGEGWKPVQHSVSHERLSLDGDTLICKGQVGLGAPLLRRSRQTCTWIQVHESAQTGGRAPDHLLLNSSKTEELIEDFRKATAGSSVSPAPRSWGPT